MWLALSNFFEKKLSQPVPTGLLETPLPPNPPYSIQVKIMFELLDIPFHTP
jgi:hypothetical protein